MCIINKTDRLHFVQQAKRTSCDRHFQIHTSELKEGFLRLLLNQLFVSFYIALGASAHLTQLSVFLCRCYC